MHKYRVMRFSSARRGEGAAHAHVITVQNAEAIGTRLALSRRAIRSGVRACTREHARRIPAPNFDHEPAVRSRSSESSPRTPAITSICLDRDSVNKNGINPRQIERKDSQSAVLISRHFGDAPAIFQTCIYLPIYECVH